MTDRDAGYVDDLPGMWDRSALVGSETDAAPARHTAAAARRVREAVTRASGDTDPRTALMESIHHGRFTVADLRAVLAENETLRQLLDAGEEQLALLDDLVADGIESIGHPVVAENLRGGIDSVRSRMVGQRALSQPDAVVLLAQLDRVLSFRLASPSTAVNPEVHTPERVAAYLTAHGWVRRPKDRNLWDLADGNETVHVHSVAAAPDYAKRTGLLVSDLASIYGTGELQVLADIAETDDA